MLRWGTAHLFGACCVLLAPHLPSLDCLPIVVPLIPLFIASRRWRWVSAVLLGASLAMVSAQSRLDDRWDASRDGDTVEMTACIDSLVDHDERRQRFVAIPARDQQETFPNRIQLSLYSQDPPLRPGQCWQWWVKLRAPRGFVNPGGFDFERRLFADGIGASGYIRDSLGMVRLPDSPHFLTEWRQALKEQLSRRAESAGLDREQLAVMAGLAIGDRSLMSARQWKVLRDSGTAHLLAISGLHIGLVAGLGWWLTGALRRPQAWRLLPGMAVAILYSALAGFSLPVQRALIMLLVLALYRWFRRRTHWGQGFGSALTLVLLLDPLAALDTGFWLSFLAIAAVLALAAERRQRNRWAGILRIQVGMSLLLGPVLLWHFGQWPLAGLPANLLAIPLFSLVVVPAVLLGLVLLPFDPVVTWFSWLGRTIDVVFDGLERLAAIAPVMTTYVDTTSLLLAMAGMLLLVIPLPGRLRCFGLVLLLPAMVIRPEPVDLRVAFLDVGQGLAVVVETRGQTLIYDTGPPLGEADAASWVIIPYLRARGRRPDRIVVSHADNDHSGGLLSLLEAYPEAQVSARLKLPLANRIDSCAEGEQWTWDGWRFEMISPPGDHPGHSNNDSCVLRISGKGTAVLLTGDIEAEAERRMLLGGRLVAADIVSVPHHGSETSSTSAFVAKVSPGVAVAAAGFGNRWDFPRLPVVQRWKAIGADVHVTGQEGAVIFDWRDGAWQVTAAREQQAAIWRSPVR